MPRRKHRRKQEIHQEMR